jgi:hypothetical protein
MHREAFAAIDTEARQALESDLLASSTSSTSPRMAP